MNLVPLMAEHLDHQDWYIRELLIANLLGILRLPEYAEKGLEMIEHDEDPGVKDLALSNIGAVIDAIKDKELQKKIAQKLIDILYSETEDHLARSASYTSILKDLEVPAIKRPGIDLIIGKDYPIDEQKIEEFKKRYLKD